MLHSIQSDNSSSGALDGPQEERPQPGQPWLQFDDIGEVF